MWPIAYVAHTSCTPYPLCCYCPCGPYPCTPYPLWASLPICPICNAGRFSISFWYFIVLGFRVPVPFVADGSTTLELFWQIPIGNGNQGSQIWPQWSLCRNFSMLFAWGKSCKTNLRQLKWAPLCQYLSNSCQKGPKVANRLSNIGKNNLLTPVALAHFASGISQNVLRLSVHNSQRNS